MAGTQYAYSFDKFLFMPSDLTAGLEYSFDHLKDEMIGYNRFTNQKVHIESAFLQNEWKTRRKISISGLVIPVVSVPRKRSMRICISRRSAERSL